ncbi:MAG: flagellar hook-length control protein FliK [Gammaproteobacteria bacterium]|nr:flagellar hook-length control protein FliK [Gammaproteobacteria bacterium]
MQNLTTSVNGQSSVNGLSPPSNPQQTGADADLFAVLFAQMNVQMTAPALQEGLPEGEIDLGNGKQNLPMMGGQLPPGLEHNPLLSMLKPSDGLNLPPNTLKSPPSGDLHALLQSQSAQGQAQPVGQLPQNTVAVDPQLALAQAAMQTELGDDPAALDADSLNWMSNQADNANLPSSPVQSLEALRLRRAAEANESMLRSIERASEGALDDGELKAAAASVSVEETLDPLNSGRQQSVVTVQPLFKPSNLMRAEQSSSPERAVVADSVAPEVAEPLSNVTSMHEVLAKRRMQMDGLLQSINATPDLTAEMPVSPTPMPTLAPAVSQPLRFSQDGDLLNVDVLAGIDQFDRALQEATDGDEITTGRLFQMTMPDTEELFTDAMRQRVNLMMGEAVQRAKVSLHPAELGQIDVSIELQDGELKLNLAAENQQVRDMVESTLPRLREMLEQRGFELGRADVGDLAQGFNGSNQQSKHSSEQPGQWAEPNGEVAEAIKPSMRPQQVSSGAISAYA